MSYNVQFDPNMTPQELHEEVYNEFPQEFYAVYAQLLAEYPEWKELIESALQQSNVSYTAYQWFLNWIFEQTGENQSWYDGEEGN